MEFSVNSSALVGLSDLMDRRWEDFESARAYLRTNARFSVLNGGLLNDLVGQHQQIVREIDAFLAAAAEGFAGPCATAVTEANLTYRRSDLSAMVRTDAALPTVRADPQELMGPVTGAPFGLADQSVDRSVFADTRRPTTWLQPPPDHHADYPYEYTFFDQMSPTQHLRDQVWHITSVAAALGLMPRPIDIFVEVVQPLSGDWAAYVGCADVYDNLAHLLQEAALCVDDGRLTIGRVWTGNAAEACGDAVAVFAVSLRAAVDPLHEAASTYRSVAEIVRAEAKLIASVLSTILDLILESALEAPSVGLEAPLELATGVADVYKVVHLAIELLALVEKARTSALARMVVAGAPFDTVVRELVVTGTVWDLSPVPAMAATAPNLPRPGYIRFQ
jgi:hypothetical protein